MIRESEEEYLGAIYRLRQNSSEPVPLSRLTAYFGYSPVSVHEMVQKLVLQQTVDYHPYHGVTLTETGESIALSLLRRHRLWERFLTDILDIPWEDAHEIADRLEHAATDMVAERLSTFLGEPDSCPHGTAIPPSTSSMDDLCLLTLPIGSIAKVTRISPETQELLHRVMAMDLVPGQLISIVDRGQDVTRVACDDRIVNVHALDAQRIWAQVI
ncbi:MAG: metal-dependent transcriptional regulator [Anaerolineae bacterium]|nr:metal-dependent transcriptional regulator [Anaerolineae bacterium]